jgi:DNA-directed RNA polymerase subunit RPC12/RpoP
MNNIEFGRALTDALHKTASDFNPHTRYTCKDCAAKWFDITYLSMEYRAGINCPRCGKKNIEEFVLGSEKK